MKIRIHAAGLPRNSNIADLSYLNLLLPHLFEYSILRLNSQIVEQDTIELTITRRTDVYDGSLFSWLSSSFDGDIVINDDPYGIYIYKIGEPFWEPPAGNPENIELRHRKNMFYLGFVNPTL